MTWLLSLAIVGALATPGAQTADDRELSQFRLTTEVLNKAEAVAKAFDANLAKDPRMKRRMDAQREIATLEKKGDLSDAEEDRLSELQDIVGDEPIIDINSESLSTMTAGLQKQPAMAAALKSAGMLPRDFAKFVVTAIQAAMISGTGMAAPAGPAGDNLRFVMANKATMDRISRILGAQ